MIKSIVRDYGTNPSIVRITSTDDYATISAAGYLTAQAPNILLANNGPFEWVPSDTVLIWYQNDFGVGAWAFFSISPDFLSLIPFSSSYSASIVLDQAQVQAAFATPQLLVAAPGAGLGFLVNACSVVTEVGPTISGPFVGGGNAIVEYDDVANGAGNNALSAVIPAAEITAASSQIYSMSGFVPTTVTATSVVSGFGLYFSNITGAFTGGVGSSVIINLEYQVVPCV